MTYIYLLSDNLVFYLPRGEEGGDLECDLEFIHFAHFLPIRESFILDENLATTLRNASFFPFPLLLSLAAYPAELELIRSNNIARKREGNKHVLVRKQGINLRLVGNVYQSEWDALESRESRKWAEKYNTVLIMIMGGRALRNI